MPHAPLTDVERLHLKPVRKVEASGALSHRLEYAMQNKKKKGGKWVVYGKLVAREELREQIRDNTLPDPRPFDRPDYVLEDDDTVTAPEINENEGHDESGMSSPAATLLKVGAAAGSGTRPQRDEALCKKVHALRMENPDCGTKAMAKELGADCKAVRDALEDLGIKGSPRASVSTPLGNSTPRRTSALGSGDERVSSVPCTS